MKNRTVITSTLILAACNVRADIDDLNWMTGCWTVTGKDAGSVEQWSRPAGKTMLGFSRVVDQGETIAFEYLQIIEEVDGGLTLIASPSGQETGRFQMIEATGDSVIFENPEHDFPQRIIYRLDDDGNLVGRIEGTIDRSPRTIEFPMERSSCDAGTSDD